MIRLKPVNLIPKEVLKKPFFRQLETSYRHNRGLRNFSFIVLVTILISLIQVSTVGVFKWGAARSKQTMQAAKAKLNQLQSQYIRLEKTKSGVVKEETLAKQRLELLLSTSSMDRRYSAVLALIAGLLPLDLWINQCIVMGDDIQIIGATLNNQMITQFMNKLDESKVFQNSRFTSSEKQVSDSHTIYNFQITTEPLWAVLVADKTDTDPLLIKTTSVKPSK